MHRYFIVRGSSVTNPYVKGGPVAEILRAADWANKLTVFSRLNAGGGGGIG